MFQYVLCRITGPTLNASDQEPIGSCSDVFDVSFISHINPHTHVTLGYPVR